MAEAEDFAPMKGASCLDRWTVASSPTPPAGRSREDRAAAGRVSQKSGASLAPSVLWLVSGSSATPRARESAGRPSDCNRSHRRAYVRLCELESGPEKSTAIAPPPPPATTSATLSPLRSPAKATAAPKWRSVAGSAVLREA